MTERWTPGDAPLGECIEWTGARNAKGYGWRTVGNKQVLAHRHAFEAAYGKLPKEASLLHICDNPACINLDHLRAGSHSDNMRDMAAKGRHAQSKLSSDDVRDMRRKVLRENNTARSVAKHYGVTPSLVSMIVYGRCWSYVPNEDGSPYVPPSREVSHCTYNARLGKWQGQVHIGGKKKYLGLFNSKEEAKRAANQARQLAKGDGRA